MSSVLEKSLEISSMRMTLNLKIDKSKTTQFTGFTVLVDVVSDLNDDPLSKERDRG